MDFDSQPDVATSVVYQNKEEKSLSNSRTDFSECERRDHGKNTIATGCQNSILRHDRFIVYDPFDTKPL